MTRDQNEGGAVRIPCLPPLKVLTWRIPGDSQEIVVVQEANEGHEREVGCGHGYTWWEAPFHVEGRGRAESNFVFLAPR
jgi:hypothetical protein